MLQLSEALPHLSWFDVLLVSLGWVDHSLLGCQHREQRRHSRFTQGRIGPIQLLKIASSSRLDFPKSSVGFVPSGAFTHCIAMGQSSQRMQCPDYFVDTWLSTSSQNQRTCVSLCPLTERTVSHFSYRYCPVLTSSVSLRLSSIVSSVLSPVNIRKFQMYFAD